MLFATSLNVVVGMAGLKRLLEVPFGPLDPQPLASQIYGLYTGLVYLTPVFGGYLADRGKPISQRGQFGPS